MDLSRETALAALDAIDDPVSGRGLVDADLVRALTLDGSSIRFVLEVDPARADLYESVLARAEAALRALGAEPKGVLTGHAAKAPPNLQIGRHPTPQAGPQPIPGIGRIIAVASGKGGVGKSTVASNLAVAMASVGIRTGLLDADIHGPSLPRMMGVSGRPASPDGKSIIPLKGHGVTMMSIGLMLPEDEAVIWRGPMLMGALQQMLGQVVWGELDVLIVDLPPGTGDVQLSLVQKVPLAGVVIVSTPQDIALLDARKAMAMFSKTGTRMLGLVENMSAFVCPHCGETSHIFSHGGAASEAARQGLPLLGEVPLTLALREAGDSGTPIVLAAPDSAEAKAFLDIARKVVDLTDP